MELELVLLKLQLTHLMMLVSQKHMPMVLRKLTPELKVKRCGQIRYKELALREMLCKQDKEIHLLILGPNNSPPLENIILPIITSTYPS